jgi:hypothetical protein
MKCVDPVVLAAVAAQSTRITDKLAGGHMKEKHEMCLSCRTCCRRCAEHAANSAAGYGHEGTTSLISGKQGSNESAEGRISQSVSTAYVYAVHF